jgi:hypothetical protein
MYIFLIYAGGLVPPGRIPDLVNTDAPDPDRSSIEVL